MDKWPTYNLLRLGNLALIPADTKPEALIKKLIKIIRTIKGKKGAQILYAYIVRRYESKMYFKEITDE